MEARVALMWRMQAQFAGYALASGELRQIELIPRDPASSPIHELVGSRAEFGIVSPAQLLAAGPQARGLILVALVMPKSPIVLAARVGRSGERLEELDEGRVGVWPGEDIEVRALLLASGVPLERMEFVPVGEDVGVLLRGEVDLLQATTYNEVPMLFRQGGDPDSLVLHRPARWGVDVAKDGLVAREDVLRTDEGLVDAVVGGVIRGWQEALADPDKAVAAVCELAPGLVSEEQREQLGLIADLIDSSVPLGRPDRAEVERAARVHRMIGNEVDERNVRIDPGPWERGHG